MGILENTDSVDSTHTALPQYYREGFFSGDTLLHPELSGGRQGIAGDPVPYSIHNDSILTSLLLGSFIVALVAFSSLRQFIVRQAKGFFYAKREGLTEVIETSGELLFQMFLVLLSCLFTALLFYFYTLEYIGDSFLLSSQYLLIVIFLGVSVVYLALRSMLYAVVNSVFFDGKKNEQWQKSLLLIVALEGTLLFPCVLLRAYFSMSMENVVKYVAVVLVVAKLLTFYKCFVIFFVRNVARYQIILYFCALEIVPLLAYWGCLMATANSLKINF